MQQKSIKVKEKKTKNKSDELEGEYFLNHTQYSSVIPLKINQDFIAGWKIPPSLCENIIQEFNSKKSLHKISNSTRGYTFLTTEDINPSIAFAYQACLEYVIDQYTRLYPYSKENMTPWQLDNTYNIQYYPPGRHYSVLHCENNGEKRFQNRHLAFMTYLNTVDTGGETFFHNQNLKVKPEAGLTLVWPAYFTHMHKGLPSKTQEKYITTGWYTFFDTTLAMEETNSMDDGDFYSFLNTLNKVI